MSYRDWKRRQLLCSHGLWRWNQTHCPKCEAKKAAKRILREAFK